MLVNLGPDVSLCGAGNIPLDAGPGITYQWTPNTGLSDPYCEKSNSNSY